MIWLLNVGKHTKGCLGMSWHSAATKAITISLYTLKNGTLKRKKHTKRSKLITSLMGFSGPVETNGCQSNNTREHKILFKFYLAGSRLFGYLQIKPRSWTLMFTRSSTSQWSKMVLEPASSWFKFVALTTSPPYLILIIGCFCHIKLYRI